LTKFLLRIGTSESLMIKSEMSYLVTLVKRLGAENIVKTILDEKATYTPMNMEQLVAADPDSVLVLASGDHGASEDMYEAELKKNDIWKSLSAYQNDDIHILDYDIFGVTSILNVEQAMTEIADYFFE